MGESVVVGGGSVGNGVRKFVKNVAKKFIFDP